MRFSGYSPYDSKDESIRRLELQHHIAYQLKIYYFGESECSVGHFKLWELIAMMPNDKAYAILEDDVIVKNNYVDDVDVLDDEIVFLGPKVKSRLDYTYPVTTAIKKIPVPIFSGAHAYAITPNTAKKLINIFARDGIDQSVDAYLGLENIFNLKLFTISPPQCVCEVRSTRSFSDEEPEIINAIVPKSFVDNLLPEKRLEYGGINDEVI